MERRQNPRRAPDMPISAIQNNMDHPPCDEVIYLNDRTILIYDDHWLVGNEWMPVYTKHDLPEALKDRESQIIAYDDHAYEEPPPIEDVA